MITIVRKILCFSVEPEAQRKLTRHGSVEIYDGMFSEKNTSTILAAFDVVDRSDVSLLNQALTT